MGARIIIIALFGLLHTACMAQYYPMPRPIDARREPELLLQLKNTPRTPDRVQIQLQLCNLYLNKPFKKKADLEKAMKYAADAVVLSTSIHDSAAYTNGQLFKAAINAEWNDMKAAESILTLVNDTARIDLLIMLSFKFRVMGDNQPEYWGKAIELAQIARETSVRLHLREKEILSLFEIACVHADQVQPKAEQEILDIIGKFRSIGFRNLYYAYHWLAITQFTTGQYDKALSYSYEAIKSMQSGGDSLLAGDIYVWHGLIFREIDEFRQAFDYDKLAIKAYAEHSGEYTMPIIINQAVGVLRKMKNYPKALDFLRRLQKLYPPEAESDIVYYDLALGDVYADMKRYGQAETYLLKATALNNHLDHPVIPPAGIDRDLAHLYIDAHQYEKARPYVERALKTPGATTAYLGYVHYLMYLVDSAAGQYRAAMQQILLNHTMVDSNLAESKQREIQKLLVQFEIKEKENKIKIRDQDIALLNQKAASQKAQLSRSNLLRKITIRGALLLTIIAFLLYRSYRIKQRINRIILQKNEALEQLVIEKEWLLKEVHHRVKNNLHTVNCLLEAQACYLENDALKAIQKSQQRIYAMSMIHQKIYQSEDIRTINMATYLPEFIGYLRDSFGAPPNIQFQLEVEALELGVVHAVPVALIVNEAVNNSIKYAFAENKGGQIMIALRKAGRKIKLSVADNGIGIRSELMDGYADSLGMQLMKGLSREMKGEITIETGNGTQITILFDPESIDEFQPLNIPSKETAMIV